MSAERFGGLLDQIATLPLLPEGVVVGMATIDGALALTFCHPDGISTVPVDAWTGLADADALQSVVSQLMLLPEVVPDDEPFDGRPLVTVPEAARWLGWSRSVTYEAARQGVLPTLRRGRYIFIPVAALLAFVRASSSSQGKNGA